MAHNLLGFQKPRIIWTCLISLSTPPTVTKAINLFYVSVNLPILNNSCKQNHMVFCDWFILFSIFSRQILLASMRQMHSLIMPNHIPLYGYNTFLFHPSVGGPLGCCHSLNIKNNIFMNYFQQFLCGHMFSFRLRIQKQNHMVKWQLYNTF